MHDSPHPTDPAAATAPTQTLERTHRGAPMIVVHTAFRREFGLAPGVVRRVPAGDVDRAHLVASHLDLLVRGLDHHHHLEDDAVWPRLYGRVPEHVEPVVARMERQHEDLVRHLQVVGEAVTTWTATAAPDRRDELALALDELHRALVEHLDDEERHLLPIAVEYLTPAEWDDIGRRAEAGQRRSERALVFGLLQYEGDPDVVASMLASAPLPVRLLVPRLARRAFRRHALAVHGTATP